MAKTCFLAILSVYFVKYWTKCLALESGIFYICYTTKPLWLHPEMQFFAFLFFWTLRVIDGIWIWSQWWLNVTKGQCSLIKHCWEFPVTLYKYCNVSAMFLECFCSNENDLAYSCNVLQCFTMFPNVFKCSKSLKAWCNAWGLFTKPSWQGNFITELYSMRYT